MELTIWRVYALILIAVSLITYSLAIIMGERKKRRQKLREIRARRVRAENRKVFKDLQWAVMMYKSQQKKKKGVTIWIKN